MAQKKLSLRNHFAKINSDFDARIRFILGNTFSVGISFYICGILMALKVIFNIFKKGMLFLTKNHVRNAEILRGPLLSEK